MKKFILSMVMLLATSFSVMAENTNSNEVSMVEAYDIEINIGSLARYLHLTNDQIESVENIQKVFSDCLRYAGLIDNEEQRTKVVSNTISYDLKHMRYILNDEQYKKYVKVLNITLENRKIKWF